MKVKIIKEFRDRDDFSRVYNVGEEVAFSDNRAAEIVARGLAEEVRPMADTETEVPARKKSRSKKAADIEA